MKGKSRSHQFLSLCAEEEMQHFFVCRHDAQYAAMERDLASRHPEEISAMVSAKLRRTVLNSKTSSHQDEQRRLESLPILARSTMLARLVDTATLHSMSIDQRRDQNLRDAQSVLSAERDEAPTHCSSNSAACCEPPHDAERFLWRCSLCGSSLVETRQIFSCAAPMKTHTDLPLERFHHFCLDCHTVLLRNKSSSSATALCPRCDRAIPCERNVVAEATMHYATSPRVLQ